MPSKLSPTQQTAFEGLRHGLPLGNVFVLWGAVGSGKSTVLGEVHEATGGAFLTMKDFIDAMQARHPFGLEETFAELVMSALSEHDCVLIDDVDLLSNVVHGGCHMYPRSGWLEAPLTVLSTYAIQAKKKLIFAGDHSNAVRQRSYQFGIGDFTPADYEFLCRAYLGAAADCLDYEKVHRFAPKLNAHQLKAASVWLKPKAVSSPPGGRLADEGAPGDLTTELFIDYLRSQYLASNVNLGEVQEIELHDLKGVDDVIQSLEAHIILPLENDTLAKELGLKPKRGVLLAGPPGTGKTSVGRALAHRLKSKFFLVDGTFISGTHHFYNQIHQLFEAAKQNAPSILFIDDSDAIFESGEELGLYRYLLTMLDGLESASAGRVCVMLTAMDISNLPPALIRSGRIELWLEMRLPEPAARVDILRRHIAGVGTLDSDIDIPSLVAQTEGFTGADLKRLIEDGKILLAHDLAQGRPRRPSTDYFLAAVESVRQNKERYAEAEARARTQRPQRPHYFEPSYYLA
jgi:transitional endoplasmic reticulum ATPase